MEEVGFLLNKDYKKNIDIFFPKSIFFDKDKKKDIEAALKIKINNIKIFEQAFLHSSFVGMQKNIISNERLEFLGDAVLELVITDFLFVKCKDKKEGELTEVRSRLVKKETLAMVAKKLNIESFLILTYGARKNICQKNDSILANVVEAIIAAIYIDSGIEKAAKFIYDNLINSLFDTVIKTDKNYKKQLQEILQSHNLDIPIYDIVEESGDAHAKIFKVEVSLQGVVLGRGEGTSKKQAAQEAAKYAMEHLSFSKKI